MDFNPHYDFAKGGKTKKFPVAVKRRIDEINEMLPKVNESGDYASTYAGSTMESYIILDKPIQIKGNYVYISEEDSRWGNYGFEKRYNVNDTRDTYESINGRKALMSDLGIIKRAFTKLLKSEGKMAKGGKVPVAYYRFGKYEEMDSIDRSELDDMILLGYELDGFNIDNKHQDYQFYAYESDIDEDDDGTSVKNAYAIKSYAKGGSVKTPTTYKGFTINYTQGKYRAEAYGEDQLSNSNFSKLKKEINDYLKTPNRYAKGGKVSKYKTGITKYGKNQYAVRVDIGDKDLIPRLLNDRWDSKSEAEAFAKRLAKRNNGTYVGEDGLFAKGGKVGKAALKKNIEDVFGNEVKKFVKYENNTDSWIVEGDVNSIEQTAYMQDIYTTRRYIGAVTIPSFTKDDLKYPNLAKAQGGELMDADTQVDYAKGGKVRNMDEAYVRMNKGYVATIRKYEDLVNHPNIDDSPELIEIVNMNDASSDKFKNQVTDFVSDIIVKTPPRYVEIFLNHANRDVYIYCSHPNGVFGTYEMPNGREFDIFIPYISKGSRELNVEKYKAKSAFTKSMKKYIEENCTKNAKGGWIQKATKEMEKDGTEGSFSAQANRAGMSTTKFAKDVLKNPSKFKEKTRKRAMFMKNTNPNKFNVGGEIVRAYDVNRKSGVGTYAEGGEIVRAYDVNNNSGVGTYARGGQTNETINLKSYNISGKVINSGKFIADYENETITFPSGKTFKVVKDYEYTSKVLKTKIKAIGGIRGFVKFLKEINTPDSPFNPSMTNRYINYGKKARGGKTQGYNAQLDESLSVRKGAKRTKQQSDKDRRDESKAMSKSMGRRAYASVRGMDKGRRMMAKGGELSKSERDAVNKIKSIASGYIGKDFLDKNPSDRDVLRMIKLKDKKADIDNEIARLRKQYGLKRFATGGKITMAGDTDFPSELLNYAKGGKFASGGNVSYNGWTNYATWVTNLEILDGMDWKDYNMGEPISAEMVQDYVDQVMQESPELALSFANRFLNDVNYYEIVEHINDEFDLDDGEKDEYAKGGKTKKSIRKKPFKRYKGRK